MPIEILDSSDLNELDPSAKADLLTAATRFRDGDLDGAVAAAYAAVDSVVARVHRDKNLGEVNYQRSFQARCKKALDEVGIYTAIADQLKDIEWKEGSVKDLQNNLKGSVDQAAYVIQLLRGNMSDAHGSKPVIKPLVFDSIKWSQIIIRLLSQPAIVTESE